MLAPTAALYVTRCPQRSMQYVRFELSLMTKNIHGIPDNARAAGSFCSFLVISNVFPIIIAMANDWKNI